MNISQIDRNRSYRLSAGIGGFDDWEVVRLRTQCTKGSGTLRLILSCGFPLSILQRIALDPSWCTTSAFFLYLDGLLGRSPSSNRAASLSSRKFQLKWGNGIKASPSEQGGISWMMNA
jgi:hypothetical protein